MRVPDPVQRFRRWFAAERRAGVPLPEAMALATVGTRGRPSVRFVLLKQVDALGFVFFTDVRSRKGRELRGTRRAAIVWYWNRVGRQVRVEGRVAEVTPAEADAYWETRPRESRLAARASTQSAPLPSRAWLAARWQNLERRYRGRTIPRPPGWIGFRIVPESIEFWVHHPHRLHYRERFVRTGRGWARRGLQP